MPNLNIPLPKMPINNHGPDMCNSHQLNPLINPRINLKVVNQANLIINSKHQASTARIVALKIWVQLCTVQLVDKESTRQNPNLKNKYNQVIL